MIDRIGVPGSPSGLVISRDKRRLYITCGGPEGFIQVVDTSSNELIAAIPSGYQAQEPVLNSDESVLYVCNRFDNSISVIDLQSMKVSCRIDVPREPYSVAVTPDGSRLLVAHHLHSGRSDIDTVTTCLSVIEVATGKTIKKIPLPNGSTLLREIRVSPSGRYAVVPHILARFHLPTTQIERGWINSNVISVIDLVDMTYVNTVLLDNLSSGASTAWAADWTEDGGRLLITHAGTHELSVIDFPALMKKLESVPRFHSEDRGSEISVSSSTVADVPNDLTFLLGIQKRIKLTGKGPRSISVAGNIAWIANYFSDTLERVDLSKTPIVTKSIPLGPKPRMTASRIGELYFNDATLCFQGWQACSSCHSHDGRVDGLNWDNLNDGLGNPKNVKSLLFASQTPPMMWLGVRSDSKVAVRAGIRHGLFSIQAPEVAESLDAYLESLQPMPSPFLCDGELSQAAKRGRQLFFNERIGCARCHEGPLYTDQKFHNVGTASKYDKADEKFDTPSLIELWRTAPYLHDGSAANLRDVLDSRNSRSRHSDVSSLKKDQVDDLVAFLLSL